MQLAPASPPRLRRLTQREYLRLAELGAFEDERVELVDGAIITMSPAGSLHDATIAKLNRLLSAVVGQRGFVRVQMSFDGGAHSLPEPDLLVVVDGDYDDSYPHEALVLVEVADSSITYDRSTKAEVYARAGVPVYWLVDLQSLALEVRTKPVRGRYTGLQVFRPGDTVTVPGFPRRKLRVSDFLPSKRN